MDVRRGLNTGFDNRKTLDALYGVRQCSGVAEHYYVPEKGEVVAERYRIKRELGRGGFGVVFVAEQLNVGREVALKTLLPHVALNPEQIDRFEREAQLVKDLIHPNTVRLYDFGQTEGGLLFIAMEHLTGETLTDILQEHGPFTEARACHIIEQVLKALHEAHQQGIVHRDLKPDNIMLVDVPGEIDFIKVLDFGIAKAIGPDSKKQKQLTKTNESIGTPPYMAPELLLDGVIGPWTDLYAVGLIFIELLTGYCAVPPIAAIEWQCSPKPINVPTSISRPLAKVLEKAVDKAPGERFQTAQEFLSALRATPAPSTPVKLAGYDEAQADTIATPSAERATRRERPSPPRFDAAQTKQPRSQVLVLAAPLVVVLCALVIIFAVTGRDDNSIPNDPPPTQDAQTTVDTTIAVISSTADTGSAPQPSVVDVEPQPEPQPLAELVLISAGQFAMGSPEDEPYHEENEIRHDVTISYDFYIQTTEVTQRQWRDLMGNNPSLFAACGEDCPVEMVNWYEALAYCNALSRDDDLDECYTLSECTGEPGRGLQCSQVSFSGLQCSGYRLPTEAEWEYAARAGSTTATFNGPLTESHRPYASDSLEAIAWYVANSDVDYENAESCAHWLDDPRLSQSCGTHPVGQKEPNSWGLYDMLGNVWEWTYDAENPYPSEPVDDPIPISHDGHRMLRGGCWMSRAWHVRSALRYPKVPDTRTSAIGFRPVRTSH